MRSKGTDAAMGDKTMRETEAEAVLAHLDAPALAELAAYAALLAASGQGARHAQERVPVLR